MSAKKPTMTPNPNPTPAQVLELVIRHVETLKSAPRQPLNRSMIQPYFENVGQQAEIEMEFEALDPAALRAQAEALAEQQREMERLREALEWYARKATYQERYDVAPHQDYEAPITRDLGAKARQALTTQEAQP